MKAQRLQARGGLYGSKAAGFPVHSIPEKILRCKKNKKIERIIPKGPINKAAQVKSQATFQVRAKKPPGRNHSEPEWMSTVRALMKFRQEYRFITISISMSIPVPMPLPVPVSYTYCLFPIL
jgi:hypothetical protein